MHTRLPAIVVVAVVALLALVGCDATTTTAVSTKPAPTTQPAPTTTAPSTTTTTSTTSTTTTTPSTTTTTIARAGVVPADSSTALPGTATHLAVSLSPATDVARLTWTRPSNLTDNTAYTRVVLVDVTTPGAWVQAGSTATCFVDGVCDQGINLRGVLPRHQYMAVVQGHNQAGDGPAAWSAPFTPTTSCAVDACVNVNAATPGNALANKASGVLGTDAVPTGKTLLNSLGVTWWRLSTFGLPGGPNPPDYQSFDKARNRGAKIIEVLSDDWWQQVASANGGKMPKPASNWSAWDAFVTAKVQQSITDGRNPDYWEVWNEPDAGTNVIGGAFTPTEQLQLYAHTWHTIKAADPHAKLAFAGSTVFAERSGSYPNTLGIPELLDFVQNQHLTIDALTYHDGKPTLNNATSGFADELIDRAATARRWLDERHLTSTKVVVDEYLGPVTYGLPAATLAYDSALERSAADGGVRACWDRTWPSGSSTFTASGCLFGQLDNLTDLSGNNPLAAWWVQDAYANLAGQIAPTTSTSSWIPALAAVAADGTTSVLVGQYRTCTGDIWASANPACSSAWTSAPPMTTQVRVHLPTQGTWAVSGQRIPNTPDAVGALPSVAVPATVTANASGDVTVTVSIADGEVQHLTFTPLG